MNHNIFPEARFFAVSFITGVILMTAFDIIIIFRFLVKHNKIVKAVENVLYWSIAGVFLFIMMYNMNFGIIRGFSIITVWLGMYIYHRIRIIISKPLKKYAFKTKMAVRTKRLVRKQRLEHYAGVTKNERKKKKS